MIVRAATLDDVPAMMALARAAPSAAHWSRGHYETAVSSPDRVALVSGEDLAVEAFVVARVLDQEWEIENIVVARDRRNRGLGARLLAETFARALARNAAAIFLEVRESNQAARSFYENNGFVPAGRRPRYYPEPEEDALVYRRVIG